jgi:hypothetical protein
MPVSRQRAPIRPLLVDEGLENVRQQSRAHRACENVRAETPDRLLRPAGEQKAQSGSGDQHMLVGAPGQSFRRALGPRVGVAGDRIGDLPVELRWTNSNQSHDANRVNGQTKGNAGRHKKFIDAWRVSAAPGFSSPLEFHKKDTAAFSEQRSPRVHSDVFVFPILAHILEKNHY